MRLAVVGCGLIGAAVARELQRRGARTVIYEALSPGAGTSGTTFAWVNAHDKQPRAYHDLNVAGMAAHLELRAERSASDPWLFPTGNLVCGEDAARDRLVSWGYPVRELAPDKARELEPDLLIGKDVDRAFLFPSEGYVLPHRLLERLLGEALELGAELRCPARIDHLDPSNASVTLHLGDGSTDTVDAAVCCAGRWTPDLLGLPLVDHETPGSPAVGLLAYTRPTTIRLGRLLTTPKLNVRPDGDGRLTLQALDLDATADTATGPEFLRRLAEVLHGGDRAELEGVRVGFRVLPLDGQTVAGHVDGADRVYVIATHSGVTLAPLLGRLAAAEIVDGDCAAILEPFRPQRFSREWAG
jgi:glycine/D-amino acid oxidase-like deaminating enzyme